MVGVVYYEPDNPQASIKQTLNEIKENMFPFMDHNSATVRGATQKVALFLIMVVPGCNLVKSHPLG